MNDLLELIDGWQRQRIMVVGDYMLDRAMYGNADRLCPDAPVPVLAIVREESNAGGAANVCFDLAALRCDVLCMGVVGADEAGQQLRGHLASAGCDVSGIVTSPDRPTIVKQSFIGLAQHRHPQKMFRADHERLQPLTPETEKALLAGIEAAMDGLAAVCLQDHNKGMTTVSFCQAIIDIARQHHVPVLVDPALTDDYTRYAGATYITPNRFEAATAVGRPKLVNDEAAWPTIGQQLLTRHQFQAVVMTLDRHGALLVEQGAEPQHLPTVARNVYDVTGAGDMMLAALAAALGNGASRTDAVRLANIAGGLEVEKFGVVPIPLEELHLAVMQRVHDGHNAKLRTLQQLVAEINAFHKLGRTIAFTNGCFDILHAGHVDLLRKAKQTADLLIVAVNTDVSIRQLKGPARPIVPEDDRVRVLNELECVDYLLLFGDGGGGDGDTPKAAIEAIRPDVLIKGGDYTAHDMIVGADFVKSHGGKVVVIPLVEGRSTTNIVERIRAEKR